MTTASQRVQGSVREAIMARPILPTSIGITVNIDGSRTGQRQFPSIGGGWCSEHLRDPGVVGDRRPMYMSTNATKRRGTRAHRFQKTIRIVTG